MFPSDETISSELYPLERTLRIYTTQRSLNRQEVQAFLTSYLRQSEDLAVKDELIPVGDSIRTQELKRIKDPTAYDKAASGAVSEPGTSGAAASGRRRDHAEQLGAAPLDVDDHADHLDDDGAEPVADRPGDPNGPAMSRIAPIGCSATTRRTRASRSSRPG